MEDIIKNAITFPRRGKTGLPKEWNKLTTSLPHEPGKCYGILCGKISNIIVLDCDLIKNDNPSKYMCGVQAWNKLCEENTYLKNLEIPCVKTKSGGLHLYFKYNDKLKSGVQVLTTSQLFNLEPVQKVKIDILSDNKSVIGPNSPGYKFINNTQYFSPPEFPEILIHKFTDLIVTEKTKSIENLINCDTPITKSKLSEIVDQIPDNHADDRDTWLKIIWAIEDTSRKNGYNGLDIAIKFSKKSAKFTSDLEVECIYNQSKGEITLGTLYYYSSYKTEMNFNKDILLNSLKNCDKDFSNIEEINKMEDEDNRKILEVIFKNNKVKNIYLYKNNLATKMEDTFKGYIENILNGDYDLSVLHPRFKGDYNIIFKDENTLECVYKENEEEHRIKIKNPFDLNKSYYTLHSLGKQLGNIKRSKQDIQLLLNDAIAPACHKILSEKYNITVNCQNAIFNFGDPDDDHYRNESTLISDLLKAHPRFTAYVKYHPQNDTIYVCSSVSGIWKKMYPCDMERLLESRIKKHVPGLTDKEIAFIGKQSGIQALRKMSLGYVSDETIEEKLNETRTVFAMSNCVYDLEINELRKPVPQDYIQINTGWEYNEDEAMKYLTEVEEFFTKLFPFKEEHDVIVTYLASLLHGYRLDKKFIAMTDKRRGNNGKTSLISLLNRFFKDYIKTSNKFLLKGSYGKDKDSHDGGLEPLKGKRILVCDELKKSMKLDEGLVKNLAGGEYIVEGRRLGKSDQFKFTWQAGIIMIFNEGCCPKFDSTDEALMERMIIVPMRSKFVNDQNELNDDTFTYMRDSSINDRFDLWRSSLLKFFLKYVRKNGIENTKIPTTMKEWKDEIITENNELGEWLFNIVEKIEDRTKYVSLSELYTRHKNEFPNDKSLQRDFDRNIISLMRSKDICLKEQYQFRDDGKKIQRRNVFLGIKFTT